MGCFVLHKWNGCACVKCGKTRKHKFFMGRCSHCGLKCDHKWVLVDSTDYGGNDSNGWGPGGRTTDTYRCSICQQIDKSSYSTDDD